MEPKDNPSLPVDTIEKILAAQDSAAEFISGAIDNNSNPNSSQAPITLKEIQDMKAQMDALYSPPPPVSYPNPYMPSGIMSMPNDPRRYFHEILSRISYKPGWKIHCYDNNFSAYDESFIVTCVYEGYESDNAAFDPICVENSSVSGARERLAMSLGKSVRQRNHFTYTKSFSKWNVARMSLEQIIKYVIFGTIKEAESHEIDRWFRYEGESIFGNERQDYMTFTQEMSIEEAKKRWPYTPIPGEVKR